eukprot:SAG11_NODE_3413_length_2463_cov_2.345178_1_plen_109_part_00
MHHSRTFPRPHARKALDDGALIRVGGLCRGPARAIDEASARLWTALSESPLLGGEGGGEAGLPLEDEELVAHLSRHLCARLEWAPSADELGQVRSAVVSSDACARRLC